MPVGDSGIWPDIVDQNWEQQKTRVWAEVGKRRKFLNNWTI